jgi:ParB family chromosome partitioning protein
MSIAEVLEVTEIPMSEIYADEQFNCRGSIIPFHVMDLAKNIQENGLIQPIIVQPYPGPKGEKYRVVAGYRRHLAHKVNKSSTIKSIIHHNLSDDDARFLNLSENLNREDLNLMQEAKTVNVLLERGFEPKQIAEKLNITPQWVYARMHALAMPEEIQEEIAAGVIKQENLKALYGLRKEPEKQFELVKKIKTAKAKGEKLRVKSVKAAKKDPKVAMVRDKVQMDLLQDHIVKFLGYDCACETNFAIRVLAWCRGDISTLELCEEDMKEIAETEGKIYIVPTEDFALH